MDETTAALIRELWADLKTFGWIPLLGLAVWSLAAIGLRTGNWPRFLAPRNGRKKPPEGGTP